MLPAPGYVMFGIGCRVVSTKVIVDESCLPRNCLGNGTAVYYRSPYLVT